MDRLDAVRRIDDVQERARAAAALMDALDGEVVAARDERDRAVIVLLDGGMTKAEAARVIGTTRGFMAYYSDEKGTALRQRLGVGLVATA